MFCHFSWHVWVTESYSGENVGHRPGERAAVLHRATIGITEIAIRFQNEITLAATITPRPRTMRDDRRPPTLRNCTELSTAPRVSARAFPVDANLRDLARLHAGHGAILRFNQSLGYGKLLLRVEDVDSHGDAIAQRRAAGVPCDKLKSFCRMTVRNHRDVVERRHFVFSVVHQLQFDGV